LVAVLVELAEVTAIAEETSKKLAAGMHIDESFYPAVVQSIQLSDAGCKCRIASVRTVIA
jgi:hypothetical protein